MLASVGLGVAVAAVAADSAGAPTGGTPPRRVAVTFDDLPAAGLPGDGPCNATTLRDLNGRLLAQIAAPGVPATGFVTESRVCDGLRAALLPELLTSWLAAGHDLGNHTFSHPDLNRTPLDEYLRDIDLGSRTASLLLAERGRELRWFRYPMLHTGADRATRTAVEAYLETRGYRNAPVTIDNQEWVFAAVYSRALASGENELAERIADTYLDFMVEVFEFFESWSVEVLGYEPAQTLLLHANEINADHFAELARRIESRGYEFVTFEEALEDPAYDLVDGYVGPRGLSWIHRWAVGKGLELREEPREPAWIAELFRQGG